MVLGEAAVIWRAQLGGRSKMAHSPGAHSALAGGSAGDAKRTSLLLHVPFPVALAAHSMYLGSKH